MPTYTYFWTKEEGKGVLSPYFDSEKEANDWLELEMYKLEAQGLWSDSCTAPRSNE